MSDNLGPNQTRVLDSENRSFESVVYQKRKPPLSSEVNLTGKLDSDKNQVSMKYLIPSGWAFVGEILDGNNASSYETGTVLCSPSFSANNFKLVALDKGEDAQRNVAWVNGWRLLIQGTNSTSSSDEDNLIALPPPPPMGTQHRVDFVFLEVWRKLVDPSDVVFKHGNLLYGGTNPSNDLVDPAVGIETSLRIQVQYRIRVAPSDIDLYPDGFDPNQVFVQGPLDEPISTCSNAYFSPVPGDPGLWIAGAGDLTAQSVLQTVDGHTYAIPMFAVRRRNTGAYDPDMRSNGSARSRTDYLAGLASDRPDNFYNNIVASDDILDMRHRVIPQENTKEICEDAFKKLINNRLPGKMTKLTLGEDSFGIRMVQPDAVSNVDKAGSTKIGVGDGIRRVFSNAQFSQAESFSYFTPISPWTDSTVYVNLTGYPSDSSVVSVKEVDTTTVVDPNHYVVSPFNNGIKLEIKNNATEIIGTMNTVRVEYTINYPSGPYGLSQVPIEFLEARKEDTTSSIAMMGSDIRVRSAGPVVTTDGTKYNMLSNRGGRITEINDFGHQMIYHTTGNGTQTFSVPRNAYGYDILGLSKINISGMDYTGTSPIITRDANTYTVTLSSSVPLGKDIAVNLYTKTKFFEANKQGRAIIDCWEMKELVATGSGTTYYIDSIDKAILKIASFSVDGGKGYAYVGGTSGTKITLKTDNTSLPTSTSKTYGTIEFDTTPPAGTIEVPVLLHSAIEADEGYTFFYKTLPYQGLLDSSAVTGVVEAVGPAITTTSGSGTITNYIYGIGQATWNDTTRVLGTNGTQWVANARAGYFIIQDYSPEKEYLITEVLDDTTIIVDQPTSVSGSSYTIFAKDQSRFLQRNIIDLLPTYNSNNDSSGLNALFGTILTGADLLTDVTPILETRVLTNVQDIAALPADTVWVGMYSTVNGRGRSAVHISDSTRAPLGYGNLGLRFEKIGGTTIPGGDVYKKSYQSYILNKENSGELYLMVVGSETDNTNTTGFPVTELPCFLNQASNKDSVDLFELPSRPLVMRRIA